MDQMNPENRAVKSIFLSESDFAEQRNKLKNDLAGWIALISGNESQSQLVDKCVETRKNLEKNLKKNLKKAFKRTAKLETSYRTVGNFFKNSGQARLNCLTLLNADKEDLKDSDSKFFKAVVDELGRNFDRLNLKKNYSLLVIPGYLGSKQAIDIWAKAAYRTKSVFVTDYYDAPNLKMLMDKLDKDSLNGADAHLANCVVACNYLLGRSRSELANEDDHLYIPPSTALAGKMYNTEEIPISQGAAGKKYGTLDEVSGARLDMLKSEIAALIDKCMVPMVFEDNRVMAFSNKTLFSGNPIGLQEYPIVRVFDWIGKVFSNFLNDVAFQSWNNALANNLQREICLFLEDYRGVGKLFESFTFQEIVQDPVSKDISLKVDIKPFFAAKNFFIKMTGHEGSAGKEFAQEVG
jgi:hypothetical protein